jgi:plastocyanin
MSTQPTMARRLLVHGHVLAGCVAAMAGMAQAASVQVDLTDAAGKPLAGAVVFLESAEAKRLVKPQPGVEMAQDKRQFAPVMMVVPVGTEVLFPNRDTVRHHVYSFSPAKKFELKLYTGTPSKPVLFDQAGVVVLGCNIHDQMTGWILVVDTPYYASSPATGKAQIDNVPPGSYKLRAWHNRLPVGAPAMEQALTVPATGVANASVRMAGLQP